MGVLFVEPELVAELRARFARETAPDTSYTVLLGDDCTLRWLEEVDGAPIVHDREPEASFRRRVLAAIGGGLPTESQL